MFAVAACALHDDRVAAEETPFEQVFVLQHTVELEAADQDPLVLPSDVRVQDSLLFVADQLAANVKVHRSSDGAYLRSIGRPGDGPGEFRSPVALAFSGDSLLVLDGTHATVAIFDSAGTWLHSVNVGEGRPHSIEVTEDGAILVTGRFDIPPNGVRRVDLRTGVSTAVRAPLRTTGAFFEGNAIKVSSAFDENILAIAERQAGTLTGILVSADTAIFSWQVVPIPEWPDPSLDLQQLTTWFNDQTWIRKVHAAGEGRWVVDVTTPAGASGDHEYYVVDSSAGLVFHTGPTDVVIWDIQGTRAFGLTIKAETGEAVLQEFDMRLP